MQLISLLVRQAKHGRATNCKGNAGLFAATSRTNIKEINILMPNEGKELVLKNCSKWMGKCEPKKKKKTGMSC
jgi:hypothetical protein